MRYIVDDGIEYAIDEDGTLCRIASVYGGNTVKIMEIEIPGVISNTKITAIGKNAFQGEYGEVRISPEIRGVREMAFARTKIDTLHWPEHCFEIPVGCFMHSNITQILGTENVERICEKAFLDTSIKEFDWPTKCKVIPFKCFCCTRMDSLHGIGNVTVIEPMAFHNCYMTEIPDMENVEEIGMEAFAYSSIRCMKWPPKCKTIPNGCFKGSELSRITNLKNIEIIEQYAFYYTANMRKIDLSESTVVLIGEGAFDEGEKKTIKLPYYGSLA